MDKTLSKPENVEQLDAEAGCPAPLCSVFSYFDNRDVRHIFLEVEAGGILEADEVLKAETGIVAAKTPGVGCVPNSTFTFEPMTDDKARWIEEGGYNYFSQNDPSTGTGEAG